MTRIVSHDNYWPVINQHWPIINSIDSYTWPVKNVNDGNLTIKARNFCNTKREVANFYYKFQWWSKKPNGEQEHFVQSSAKYDPDFELLNEMFKTVLKNIKRSGKGSVVHKKSLTRRTFQYYISVIFWIKFCTRLKV